MQPLTPPRFRRVPCALLCLAAFTDVSMFVRWTSLFLSVVQCKISMVCLAIPLRMGFCGVVLCLSGTGCRGCFCICRFFVRVFCLGQRDASLIASSFPKRATTGSGTDQNQEPGIQAGSPLLVAGPPRQARCWSQG